MPLHDLSFQSILKNNWFQQIAPLVVFFLVPALVLFATWLWRVFSFHFYESSFNFNLPPFGLGLQHVFGSVYRSLSMGIESLGLSWLWPSSSSSSNLGSPSSGKRHRKKASQGGDEYDSDSDEAQYYPGLVNISGTYCFMNSTLQAMSSLAYLQPQIQAIQSKAEALDVPTPVVDALQELFTTLNTPKSNYNSLRPHGIIDALSAPPPLPSSSSSAPRRQELFQLVSECIKNEMAAVEREGQRDRGIAGVLDLAKSGGGESNGNSKSNSKSDPEDLGIPNKSSVFDGLTANRRSCVVCGYTEAVMHFGFDNWQLALPRLATSCRLEDCLEDYTRLEILKDCICRNCSVLATHKRLLQELKTLEEALGGPPSTPDLLGSTSTSTSGSGSASTSASSSAFAVLSSSSAMPSTTPPPLPLSSTSPTTSTSTPNTNKPKPSTSKKKRYKEVKKMEQRVRTALAEGRIEDDALLEGVRLERVVSPASTKQAMIARPPQVLALHLNRSMHYGQYASKNTIRVYFPEVLDLTPYTTSGSLSTVPTSSISSPLPTPPSQSGLGLGSPSPFYLHDQGQGPSRSGTTNSNPKRPTTPTQETYTAGYQYQNQRTIYRLAAVVCHYGQHSFGHYICYRRKPRKARGNENGGKWVPPTLVDPLRFELDEENEDGEEESKPNGAAHHNPKPTPRKTPNYSGSSTLGESRYYWEDHTEEEVGTGKGWLRISDDAVSECGVESVLAEGSGAFMLFYERAVFPVGGVYLRRGEGEGEKSSGRVGAGIGAQNGHGHRIVNGHAAAAREDEASVDDASTVDGDGEGDGFSIGSEETLKPEMRVVNLNGSVGSLMSEVGVGVMKVHHKKNKDKDKERKKLEKADRLDKHDSMMSMSLHLPSSSWASGSAGSAGSASMSMKFGARIVRSVNARRRTTQTPESSSWSASSSTVASASASSSSASSSAPSSSSSSSSSASPLAGALIPLAHGSQDQDMDGNAWADMTASAPSILSSTSTNATRGATASTTGAHPTSNSTTASLKSRLGSKSTKVIHHHHHQPHAGVKVDVVQ
ncbi:hypothetical protein CPB84DRAFT_1742185 [Gymnopilus junonius]|uniref:ubiquitinyl hydrolase 1 n=1 Tax=Gymnopilus junonius TaxID=109634 RepID=A0A9P5TU93_GYMJU|nr:hypothetical protein CPB84DRAFT_1742185 [Gymnopilus junonius]